MRRPAHHAPTIPIHCNYLSCDSSITGQKLSVCARMCVCLLTRVAPIIADMYTYRLVILHENRDIYSLTFCPTENSLYIPRTIPRHSPILHQLSVTAHEMLAFNLLYCLLIKFIFERNDKMDINDKAVEIQIN